MAELTPQDAELAVASEAVMILRERMAQGMRPTQALASMCKDLDWDRAPGWQHTHPHWMSYNDRREILDGIGEWHDKFERRRIG